MQQLQPADFRAAMRLDDLPSGRLWNARVDKFIARDCEEERAARAEGRGVTIGKEYTRLCFADGWLPAVPGVTTGAVPRWVTWMSDTEAEMNDHMPCLMAAQFLMASRAVVNGLGLGMVVRGLLALETIWHIDVVEREGSVIELGGAQFAGNSRVTIHHADAFAQARRWPKGTTWDIAWHDIWVSGDSKYKDQVTRLKNSYKPRVKWQGTWAYKAMFDRNEWR